MSWSSAAEGAAKSTAGSTAGGAAPSVATGATGSSIYGQMADQGMGQTPTAASSGFEIETSNVNTGVGPTVANAPNTGYWDSAMNNLEKFQAGQKASMPEAWRARGNNPETYGYLYNKFGEVASMGGGGKSGAAPITTNINYQQPENEYLRKRRGY